ncbi:MAG: CoA transferase [Deltaproteobacteria bacterium]|nr:CoA transferase [Deltaproteobacteria bacterium]MBW2360993.1 CoA transferase [Deltaproteobacteria bacterium]
MTAICEGIRVLDFGEGLATSLASMILADNGAEVIAIESPQGHPLRAEPAWVMWGRGKRSVVLDFEKGADRERAGQLAAGADVLIESFLPGRAEGLGIGYEGLAARNAGLLYCSVSAFGSAGAYRHLPAYEGIVQAKGGGFQQLNKWMRRDELPFRVRPDASYAAANLLLQAIMGGLRARDELGRGQRIETTLYQGLTAYESPSFEVDQMQLGLLPEDGRRAGGGVGVHLALTYLVSRCKDGQWIQATNNTARLFPAWMRAIGLGHIYEDERFERAPFAFQDDADRMELRKMILRKMAEKTADEWLEIFVSEGLAGDLFLTTQQCMDHPQTLHNEGVVDLVDPEVGPTRQIGPLVRFSKTPSRIERPAPQLGQHTRQVLEASRSWRPGTPASARRAALAHPFEGMLVLDFASWLAAPFGTSLLADLGARVIKVESLQGDEFRTRSQGRDRTFQGKENLAIDLKTPEGREVIHRLMRKADGMMHNMRGNTAKRLGIDYDTARKLNPEIVYLYGGSYGSTGPGAGRPAFHPTAGALAGGAMWQIGRGNAPPPNDDPLEIDEVVRWGETMLAANEGTPDVTAALAVGTGLAMALYHKARTGLGQYVETSMLNSNAYVCSDDFVRYEGKPPRHEPDSDLRGMHALRRLYRTTRGWAYLDCASQAEWEALCRGLERVDLLGDARFLDTADRTENAGALAAILAPIFERRSAEEWEALLSNGGAPCVAADAQSPGEFFLTDPSVAENGLVVRTQSKSSGPMYRQGPPARFTLTPGSAGPPHAHGEDTLSILEELGLSTDAIGELLRKQIVCTPESRAERAR